MSENRSTIIKILNDVSPSSTFDPEKDGSVDLVDLGIDSLDQMSLFLALQEQFEIDEIPEDDIDDLTTIDLIVTYIDQRTVAKT